MNEENKKIKEGYVKEFDNHYGIIITLSGREYEFGYRDIETPEICVGDKVVFFAQDSFFAEHPVYIAKHISKRK